MKRGKGISRRDLLKGAAVGTAAAAAAVSGVSRGLEMPGQGGLPSLSLGARRAEAAIAPWSGTVRHYELYSTDGYINSGSGVWPPAGDQTLIAGWPAPVYLWGFTDIDPNIPANLLVVPPKAAAPQGGPVGNAKFVSPFVECAVGDDVYITLHNRGFYQKLQKIQDDHSIHFHGIHAQTPYDGFPESAGSYSETLRYFWQEPFYLALGATPKARDAAWNAMSAAAQQAALAGSTPLVKANQLNPGGGVTNQFNLAPPPLGVGGLTPVQVEDATQFTYYFRAEHPGTYMYHCHVAASEHVQMGMYGALVIRPADGSLSVYGAGTNSDFDVEHTFILSEIDPLWHIAIEKGTRKGFYPPNWKPQLWFVNGRTFPTTVLPFAWNLPAGASEAEPRYNTYIKVPATQRFLIRYINMGYQEHPMHQHGWHMRIVGSDGRPWTEQREKFTILIGSGETYDVITTANPTYGVTDPAGSALSTSPNWRGIYVIHDHDDYRVTTNGLYPGGAAILIEATGVAGFPPGTPTFVNPYVPPPGIQPVP
jgi:hypothetical protein